MSVDKINESHIGVVNHILEVATDEKGVITVEPFRLNKRIMAQQGLFLFPTAHQYSFESNLCTSLGLDFDTLGPENTSETTSFDAYFKEPFRKARVVKLVIPRKTHNAVLRDLHEMNVTYATLFPDLEGLARSFFYDMRGHFSPMQEDVSIDAG